MRACSQDVHTDLGIKNRQKTGTGPGKFSKTSVGGAGKGSVEVQGRGPGRKTFRGCMSILLRSCSQDFVQEVPAGQMAQGTPLGARPAPPEGGRGRSNLPTLSNTPPKVDSSSTQYE